MANQTTDKNLLVGEKLDFIGLVKGPDANGDLCYRNVLLKVEDGKIVSVATLSIAYSPNDAINDATGWIDQRYWRD